MKLPVRQVTMTVEVQVPEEVWVCIDCCTISDLNLSKWFHIGHIGEAHKTNKLFAAHKEPKFDGTGEIIWVDKRSL